MAGRLRLAGLGAVALLGCRVPPPDLSRDPAQLLESVRAAQARVQRVEGSARVWVDSPERSGWVDQFLAAEKPDRVRIETRDFFGNVAAVLVAGGGRFALYDARAKVHYRGEATPENLSRMLPLALPPADLAGLLCGAAPILEGAPREVEVRGSLLVLRLAAASGEQELSVGEEAAVEASLLRRASPAPGQPDYHLEFDAFRRRGGARFPTVARLEAPAARVRVELRWKEDLEVNGSPDPALFRLDPPRGARVVDLEPGSAPPRVELPARPDPARE
ncbi:MAG TPA: DUF4292 domain-containing protein [Anaeromyxobacteraceae bacterium]|nr:DUF4292 domain-containing protein [Anaeromyxobacteraceae bacterium]